MAVKQIFFIIFAVTWVYFNYPSCCYASKDDVVVDKVRQWGIKLNCDKLSKQPSTFENVVWVNDENSQKMEKGAVDQLRPSSNKMFTPILSPS